MGAEVDTLEKLVCNYFVMYGCMTVYDSGPSVAVNMQVCDNCSSKLNAAAVLTPWP